MSNFDYGKMYEMANRLLNRFGRVMSVRRVDLGTFDPVTGLPSNPQTTDISCIGVIVAINETNAAGFTLKIGDRIAFINVPVTVADRLVIDQDWQIVNVDEYNPAGTFIISRVQIRK